MQKVSPIRTILFHILIQAIMQKTSAVFWNGHTLCAAVDLRENFWTRTLSNRSSITFSRARFNFPLSPADVGQLAYCIIHIITHNGVFVTLCRPWNQGIKMNNHNFDVWSRHYPPPLLVWYHSGAATVYSHQLSSEFEKPFSNIQELPLAGFFF